MRWSLAARQGVGAAVECQVVQSYVDKKLEAVLQFFKHLLGDFGTLALQLELRKYS